MKINFLAEEFQIWIKFKSHNFVNIITNFYFSFVIVRNLAL